MRNSPRWKLRYKRKLSVHVHLKACKRVAIRVPRVFLLMENEFRSGAITSRVYGELRESLKIIRLDTFNRSIFIHTFYMF